MSEKPFPLTRVTRSRPSRVVPAPIIAIPNWPETRVVHYAEAPDAMACVEAKRPRGLGDFWPVRWA